ncbi:Ff.00g090070.m01.CDS01 [Fusarium sp. VM40]|nr:Ff.00g090070.m01.CDS01 [Fusarium sp. VM40]
MPRPVSLELEQHSQTAGLIEGGHIPRSHLYKGDECLLWEYVTILLHEERNEFVSEPPVARNIIPPLSALIAAAAITLKGATQPANVPSMIYCVLNAANRATISSIALRLPKNASARHATNGNMLTGVVNPRMGRLQIAVVGSWDTEPENVTSQLPALVALSQIIRKRHALRPLTDIVARRGIWKPLIPSAFAANMANRVTLVLTALTFGAGAVIRSVIRAKPAKVRSRDVPSAVARIIIIPSNRVSRTLIAYCPPGHPPSARYQLPPRIVYLPSRASRRNPNLRDTNQLALGNGSTDGDNGGAQVTGAQAGDGSTDSESDDGGE